MKLLTVVISAAAVAAVVYLGDKGESITRTLTSRLDRLPSTSAEIVKASARRLDKEIVNAPAELAKATLKGTVNTGEKAAKDIAAEAKRVPGHAKTFADRVTGGRVHL